VRLSFRCFDLRLDTWASHLHPILHLFASVTDPDTGRVYTFNTATMFGLEAGSTVFYRVGNPLDGWSSVYSFVATRTDFADGALPLRVGVFGDLGWQNAQALAYLETEAAFGNFDFVVSVFRGLHVWSECTRGLSVGGYTGVGDACSPPFPSVLLLDPRRRLCV